MNVTATALLGLFTLGYLVLGGADIGTGMVLPLLGRTDHERRLVLTAIAPFFLGNEVWLVGALGVLAGAFPELEATLVHGLFAAFTAVLVGWVVRDMGLWLRGRVDARAWRAVCDTATVAGSWTVALGWGAVFGAILADRVGAGLLAPATGWGMLAAAALFAAHGLAFCALRLTGAPRSRARLLPRRAGEALPLLLTSALVIGIGTAAGARLAPAGQTAAPSSLTFLLPPLLVVTPLLLAVQAWMWRTFRHRVTGPMYL